jgi:hypothetical protein
VSTKTFEVRGKLGVKEGEVEVVVLCREGLLGQGLLQEGFLLLVRTSVFLHCMWPVSV